MEGVKVNTNTVLKVVVYPREKTKLHDLWRTKIIPQPVKVVGKGSEVLLCVVREVLHFTLVVDVSPLQPVHAWFPGVLYKFLVGSDVFISQMNIEWGINWGLEKFSRDEVENVFTGREVP